MKNQMISENQSLATKGKKTAITLAMDVIGGNVTEKECEHLIQIIKTEFPKLKKDQFESAMVQGMTGAFGRSYRATKQEILLWIRCYVDGKKPRDYERTNDEL